MVGTLLLDYAGPAISHCCENARPCGGRGPDEELVVAARLTFEGLAGRDCPCAARELLDSAARTPSWHGNYIAIRQACTNKTSVSQIEDLPKFLNDLQLHVESSYSR